MITINDNLSYSNQNDVFVPANSPSILRFTHSKDDPSDIITETLITIDYEVEGEAKQAIFSITGLQQDATDTLFYYDFIDVFKGISGENVRNDIIRQLTGTDVYQDGENLVRKVEIEISIETTVTGTETQSVGVFYLLNGFVQTPSFFSNSFYLYDPNYFVSNYPLLPNKKYNFQFGQSIKLTMFRGYPIDLPILNNTTNRTVLKLDYPSAPTQYFALPYATGSGISNMARFMLSDGANEIWQPTITPTPGTYDLEIYEETAPSVEVLRHTLKLTIVDKCGVYFRWLNSMGSWSHWLFPNVSNTFESKTTERLNNFIESFDQVFPPVNFNNISILGKEVERGFQVGDRFLNLEDFNFIQEIAESKQVYYFNGNKNDDEFSFHWERVDISKFKSKINPAKKNFEIEFTVDRNNQYSH